MRSFLTRVAGSEVMSSISAAWAREPCREEIYTRTKRRQQAGLRGTDSAPKGVYGRPDK